MKEGDRVYSEKLEEILMELAERLAKGATTAAEVEALAAIAMAIIENRKNTKAEITGACLPTEDEVAAHLASIHPATPDYQAWQRLSEKILGQRSESHR